MDKIVPRSRRVAGCSVASRDPHGDIRRFCARKRRPKVVPATAFVAEVPREPRGLPSGSKRRLRDEKS